MSVLPCARCSAVLATHVTEDNTAVLHCVNCAMLGRGPPLVSEHRNTRDIDPHESLELPALTVSGGLLQVDNRDDQAGSQHVTVNTNSVLHSSAELIDGNYQGSDVDIDCSKISADVMQLLSDCDHAGRCPPQQSSVIALRKQMEMLARDEDIPVHCEIASNDDDDDDPSQGHSDGIMTGSEGISTTQFPDSVTALPASNVKDVGDSLSRRNMQPAADSESHEKLHETPFAKFRETVISDCDTVVYSAEGIVVLAVLIYFLCWMVMHA